MCKNFLIFRNLFSKNQNLGIMFYGLKKIIYQKKTDFRCGNGLTKVTLTMNHDFGNFS